MPARLRATTIMLLAVPLTAIPWPTRAGAQDDPTAWRVSLTPYVWGAGMKGSVGVAGSTTEINLSARDIIEQADITLTAVLEARRGQWLGRFDGTFLAASDDAAREGESDVLFEWEQGIFQGEIGYTIPVNPLLDIDLLAGGRYWRLSADVSAEQAGGDVPIGAGDRKWFDGTAGARARYRPGERWTLFAKADVGAGGSTVSWQAFTGAGYSLSTCCSLAAAYRHLDVDYDRDGVVNDTYLSGFALGLEIRF